MFCIENVCILSSSCASRKEKKNQLCKLAYPQRFSFMVLTPNWKWTGTTPYLNCSNWLYVCWSLSQLKKPDLRPPLVRGDYTTGFTFGQARRSWSSSFLGLPGLCSPCKGTVPFLNPTPLSPVLSLRFITHLVSFNLCWPLSKESPIPWQPVSFFFLCYGYSLVLLCYLSLCSFWQFFCFLLPACTLRLIF